MRKSVKVRIIIFDILNEIHQKNNNFDESFLYYTQTSKLNDQDRSMIYNIALNSIRNNLYVNKILNDFGCNNGHIFNLGHGITPDVDPEKVEFFVNTVHDLSRKYHS